LIASRQPEEIQTLVSSYEKQLEQTENNFIDIVIRSEGAISYQDVMQMPVPSIKLLIERMNNRVEEINKANRGSRR
jgi:hypothetical protein